MTFNITELITYNGKALVIPVKDVKKVDTLLQEQNIKEYPFKCGIEQDRPKRSRNANNFAHAIMQQMADKLGASKDEIYIQMLERYGQRDPEMFDMIPEAYPVFQKATESHCTIVDTFYSFGVKKYKVAVLIGSSEYDSKQMSILIDGIVSEAEPMGIDVLTPEERSLLLQKWGKG